jgi:hypothetical protein
MFVLLRALSDLRGKAFLFLGGLGALCGEALKRRSRFLKERDFLGCGGAAKGCVPVRETPEALYHGAVPPREVEEILVVLAPRLSHGCREALVALDRARLQRPVLRMLERQIEERALRGRKLQVNTLVNPGHRKLLRGRVLGEGLWRSAMNMARELVEQNDQGEPPVRRRSPALKISAARPLVQPAEAAANLGIVLCAALEPHLAARGIDSAIRAAGPEPELEHAFDFVIRRHGHARPYSSFVGRGLLSSVMRPLKGQSGKYRPDYFKKYGGANNYR